MAITREKKEQVIDALKKDLDGAKVVVFTDYKGMGVNDLTAMRRKIRESGGRYMVAKKTLIKKALEDAGIKNIDPIEMDGQVAVAFGMEDSVSTTKAIYDTQKETEKPGILLGFMDGKVLTQEQVVQLAKLPSREELLAGVVGSINAPLSGFVNVLGGNLRGLVYTLNAIKEKKA
ncbi:MAG: 50S ribosomal protein L10 [Candidatus Spechtbacterales bacterium]|nr:50S ribosomal protein L10 [Candidatus Spechtbacterales bacterium]